MQAASHDLPPQRLDRIFLLSHMRARTSLGAHILGSHAQINGYYEMRLSYEDSSALDRQLAAYLQGDALKPGSRYLFDKLLHNDYVLQPERLGLTDIKILLSLGEPEHTLKSIVHLFAHKEVAHLYASPAEAANYYAARIEALAEFARTAPQSYFYFDAELWQRAPQRLLPRLTQWLELDSPLSGRYRTFSQTGKAGRGDTSARIRRGSIDETQTDYAHVAIPEHALRTARQAYREGRRQMIETAMDALAL